MGQRRGLDHPRKLRRDLDQPEVEGEVGDDADDLSAHLRTGHRALRRLQTDYVDLVPEAERAGFGL